MADFAGFERVDVAGVPFLWLRDRRFKTFRFSIYARRSLDERAAARSILPHLLVRGTQRDPDRPAIARRMQDLYGAAVHPATSKFGETHVLRMALDTVSGANLPGSPDQLDDGLTLLRDLLLHPRLDDGGFPEAVFAREHRQAMHMIRAIADDKGAHARERAIAEACAGEPMAIPEHGGLKAMAAVDRHAPEAARADFLVRGELWAIAMGDLPEPSALVDRFERFIASFPTRSPEPIRSPSAPAPREARRLLERTELRQSKLVLVFRTPRVDTPELRIGRSLFVTMFGGGPSSRLFTEVREKRSLAYYASATADRYKGLLVVQVGLDAAAADAAIDEILAQLAALQRGEFEDRELEVARHTLLTALQAVDDSIAQRMRFTADRWIRGGSNAPRDVAVLCAAATREAVVAGGDGIWLDQVYTLADDDGSGAGEQR